MWDQDCLYRSISEIEINQVISQKLLINLILIVEGRIH